MDDVAVTRIVNVVVVCPVTWGADLGAGEGDPHLGEEPSPVRLASNSMTRCIDPREDLVEFPHRPGAPQRRERRLGRQLEQEVPLEAGHQHARVEYRSIHGVTPLGQGIRYDVCADQGLRRTSAR